MDVSLQEFRRQMMELIGRAEGAYWALVATQDQLRMQRESVSVAEKVLRDNRERVEAGKMSELEVYQAEAGLAMRRSQLSEARQRLTAASDQLRTFLSESTSEESGLITAVDRPQPQGGQGDLASSMEAALENHPDFLLQKMRLAQQDIRLEYARNQRWPQLDLIASFGANGLGGTVDQSFADIGRRDFESWSVALELKIPIGGRKKERSELAAARLRKLQALLDLKSIETEITNAVHALQEAVRASLERVETYKLVANFTQRLLDSELERLAAGKSDSRKVLGIEEELVEAKNAELRSLVEHRSALLNLEMAEGTVLRSRGLEPERRP